MGTGMCGSCMGSGKTTCPGCGGRRHTSRLTASGDMDISMCVVCGGRGQVNCSFCGGSGRVTTLEPEPSAGGQQGPGLNGRWVCQTGSWYEFRGSDPEYEVIEGSTMGETGRGTAIREGDVVTLSATNVLIGPYKVEFQDVGGCLRGVFSFFGVTMTLDFFRR